MEMNETAPLPDGPATEQAFEERLTQLIHTAHANGVDVEGEWVDRNAHPDMPNWGIEIYEIV